MAANVHGCCVSRLFLMLTVRPTIDRRQVRIACRLSGELERRYCASGPRTEFAPPESTSILFGRVLITANFICIATVSCSVICILSMA